MNASIENGPAAQGRRARLRCAERTQAGVANVRGGRDRHETSGTRR